VPQKPQRPFVPHRTPTTAAPASTAAEFRLYRPFLPGSERETVEPVAFMDSAGVLQGQSELRVQLQPIGDFLEDEPDELPPVEHFLDPLPPVQYFQPGPEGTLADSWSATGGELASSGAQRPDPSESGWVETDWQQYDWRAAAALGETSVDEASRAWATTDWDGVTHRRRRDQRESAAHAIASALDEIARRIREGDLSPSGPGPMTDPATIAATLAALLGVRR
jgi:hypothetical protein